MKKYLISPGMLVTGMFLFGSLGVVSLRAQTAGTETANQVVNGTDDAQAQLRAKIKEAASLAEPKYSIQSWMELHQAIGAARPVAENALATPDEVKAALARVQSEIDTLEVRQLLPNQNPRLGLSASLFATQRQGRVNNVALMWATADAQEGFELFRARGKNGQFLKIYGGQGASFNDYNLGSGTYAYKLVARRGEQILTSNVESITTIMLPAGVEGYSNQTGLGAALNEPLKVGGLFFRFPIEKDGKALKAMWSETSRDGKNWTRGAVVMDASSHPDLADFKLEAVNFFYDAKSDRIVIWAHWERAQGYGSGRALVASAKPGERFAVHHIYNPLGIEVRDMSTFRDDDGQGYLLAASNVPGQGANATLYLFKMNADYTDVTGIANKFMEGGYREAPHLIKTGGFYYLFFSQAAGWYPSRAGYISAPALSGPWSEARDLGNNSTFSAQSGGILDFGRGAAPVPLWMPNRWIRGEGTSRNVALPLHTKQGFAFADYAPTLLLDAARDSIVPLQEGTLLSQNQPAFASISGSQGHEVAKAFDGDYATSFQSDDKKWPFSVTTDLGTVSKVRNVQISWHIHKGSEAYYKYLIEGSLDGKEWRTLMNRTADKNTIVSKTYGFSSDLLPDTPYARYVRIQVQGAVLHNNPNNWYSPTLYEVKVYGDKGR